MPKLKVLLHYISIFINCYFSEITTCKETEDGKEYKGSLSHTKKGISCQSWDSQNPHKHKYKNEEDFPDATLADAHNYCRNPDNKTDGPWCLTMKKKVKWQYCDVPPCSS